MKQPKALAYIQGKIRYFLFYHKYLNKLIPLHIREQIKWRIDIMDPQCLAQGSCKMCGCDTTALQMADKQCDKPCYPPMYDKKTWKTSKTYLLDLQAKDPVRFKELILDKD